MHLGGVRSGGDQYDEDMEGEQGGRTKKRIHQLEAEVYVQHKCLLHELLCTLLCTSALYREFLRASFECTSSLLDVRQLVMFTLDLTTC